MSEQKAVDIIKLYEKEEAKASNFRALFQSVADLVFPRENQITSKSYPGTERTINLFDPTGVMASMEMASGLSINLVPPGQRFFLIKASDNKLNEIASVKRSLNIITERTHEYLFASNFLLQLNETLRSLGVFGTGNLYSEWVPEIGLNFRDYDIGNYLIMENNKGRVDTMLMKFVFTARQAVQEWGKENVGQIIRKAYGDEKKQNDKFDFIHVVRPREKRNPRLVDNLNMPFESMYIAVKEKIIVTEGGYEEFPYAVPRWTKSSNEVFGRGQGTFALPFIRTLQVMTRDLIECGNKYNNPAREVLDSFEGDVNVTPGANNYVQQIPSIKAIDEGVRGNFPITKDILEMQRDFVKKMFFNDIFVQLADLKGDRRTQLEIYERLREGLQRLGPPIGRINEELFNPLVTRVVLLLLRNGELPPIPTELQGQRFKIEYIGPLVLALRSGQAKGFQQWAAFVGELEAVFPGVKDNIDADSAVRRMGETFGVNIEDIATIEERDEKRRVRAEQLQQQQALEMAQAAAQGYGQTTKSPEEGSPAGEVMEAIKG